MRTWSFGQPILMVTWCPDTIWILIAVILCHSVQIFDPGTEIISDGELVRIFLLRINKIQRLKVFKYIRLLTRSNQYICCWGPSSLILGGTQINHRSTIKSFVWQKMGNYLISVIIQGAYSQIILHNLKKKYSFSLITKRVKFVRIIFHLKRPFIYLGQNQNITIYNMKIQQMIRKFNADDTVLKYMNTNVIEKFLVIGYRNKRIEWFDYSIPRNHSLK